MRVFVAGATGAVGRPLVASLLAGGHEVTGLTRSAERGRALEAQGIRPAVADALDADGVRAAVIAARPEVVVAQLTDLPRKPTPKAMAEHGPRNDRLRAEATPNLMAAAREAGARRVVAQSIAFAYRPDGEAVKTEDAPLFADAPAAFAATVAAVEAMEASVLRTDGVEGVVLRYGFFYGPGTWWGGDGSNAEMVRRRRFPIGGGGGGVWSWIHVDDAAGAAVHALDHGEPGVYNVVDDHPAPVREWLPEYAAALGAKPPRRLPKFVVRLGGGEFAAYMMTALAGASNARAREVLGWAPRLPDWREGFRKHLA